MCGGGGGSGLRGFRQKGGFLSVDNLRTKKCSRPAFNYHYSSDILNNANDKTVIPAGADTSMAPHFGMPFQLDKHHLVNTSVNHDPCLEMDPHPGRRSCRTSHGTCVFTLCKWNHIVHRLSSLTSFVHHVCEIHPYYIQQ